MRTVSSQTTENLEVSHVPTLKTFSDTLSDGRQIVIREMTGRDLLFMEEELSDFKETKRSFYLMERLNVGTTKITFDDIADMNLNDIKIVSELVAKAGGTPEEEEGKKSPQ